MITIATWNVNSIKARLPLVVEWLRDFAPDVALLQEVKSLEENFPRLEVEELGYHLAVCGQKSYNGVAVLSKAPLEDPTTALPGDAADDQARYLEATTFGLRVASIYLPNGNPIDGEKFPYKLAWMDRLTEHARALLASEQPVVLGGDYNVCPTDDDVYDAAAFAEDALCQPESRRRFRARSRTATAIGTISAAPGRRTTACGSTTCCCRRKRRTGSRRWTSTARPGESKRPPITRRSGAGCKMRMPQAHRASFAIDYFASGI
jgi:exodeoxyribonuclease III